MKLFLYKFTLFSNENYLMLLFQVSLTIILFYFVFKKINKDYIKSLLFSGGFIFLLFLYSFTIFIPNDVAEFLYQNEIGGRNLYKSDFVLILKDKKFLSVDKVFGNKTIKLEDNSFVKYNGEKYLLLNGELPKSFSYSNLLKTGNKISDFKLTNEFGEEIKVLAKLAKIENKNRGLRFKGYRYLILEEDTIRIVGNITY